MTDQLTVPRGVSGKQRQLFLALSDNQKLHYLHHFTAMGQPAAISYMQAVQTTPCYCSWAPEAPSHPPTGLFGCIASTGRTHEEWIQLAEQGPMNAVQWIALANILAEYSAGAGYPGDAFTRSLLATIMRADLANRERLGRGFPDHVGFLAAVEHANGGTARLVAAIRAS